MMGAAVESGRLVGARRYARGQVTLAGRDRAAVAPGLVARTALETRRRVDVLQHELDHQRISPDAFLVGRILQALFERASGAGLSTPSMNDGGRGNPVLSRDLHLVLRLADARKIAEHEAWIRGRIGDFGVRVMRQVLEDGRTFKELAGQLASEREISRRGDRFRMLLEELAQAWLIARGFVPAEEGIAPDG
jgi:hypothetical protein